MGGRGGESWGCRRWRRWSGRGRGQRRSQSRRGDRRAPGREEGACGGRGGARAYGERGPGSGWRGCGTGAGLALAGRIRREERK